MGQTATAVRIRQQIDDLNARWKALNGAQGGTTRPAAGIRA